MKRLIMASLLVLPTALPTIALADPGSSCHFHGKKAKEWRVIFKNPAASDSARSSLYLFFTPPGNFIAANHTGN